MSYNISAVCLEILNSSYSVVKQKGIQPPIETYEICLILVATGVLAFLIARGFMLIRKHVYRDDDQVDTSFDAGGNVNAGLTATTIVSQWTWAATLLQSSAVAAKYGISGSFWYASGATIQILLFSMLSVQLKTRAPGAKTFLQVIRARFGKRTHIVFCCFALATNVIVTAMLMLGGSAVITALVKDISVEYATTLIAAIIGGYTLIGGLGATFYVYYFNTAIIFILLVTLMFKVFEDDDDVRNPLGDITSVFHLVTCSKGPSGNKDSSYLTILSYDGLMFGLINIVGNFGTVFVDQSYWQIAVASKPKQGVVGFLLGGLAWFAIPFSMSTAMGLAYVALSTRQGEALLSGSDINEGLVPPMVAYYLLGKGGSLLVAVMVIMAVTSTGSAEVMAVTSIVVYDMYALYLKPYRHTTDTNSCILCGKGRGRMANPRDKCECLSMSFCAKCHQDTKNRSESRRAIKPEYKCHVHGPFRVYNDYLAGLRNWTTIWTTMAIIPLTICLYMIKASLGWVYLFMGILVGSAVVPITLSMFWERLTGLAMMAGSIGGTAMAVSVWLGVADTYEGGLSRWWTNTGKELAMLCGNLVAILGGGAITIIVTFVKNWHHVDAFGEEIWENTRDIDNPLSPWAEKYQKELKLTGVHRLDNRPSLVEVQEAFKRAHVMAYSMSITFTVVLVIVWPALMVTGEVMSLNQFTAWVRLSEVWVWLAMLAMIVLPLVNECWEIWTTLIDRNKIKALPELDENMYSSDQINQSRRSIPGRYPGSKMALKSGNSHRNQPSIEEALPGQTNSTFVMEPTLVDAGPIHGQDELVEVQSPVRFVKGGSRSPQIQNVTSPITRNSSPYSKSADQHRASSSNASLNRTFEETIHDRRVSFEKNAPEAEQVHTRHPPTMAHGTVTTKYETVDSQNSYQDVIEFYDIADDGRQCNGRGRDHILSPIPDSMDIEEPLF